MSKRDWHNRRTKVKAIDDIVKQILIDLGLEHHDPTPYITILKDHLIETKNHLLEIPPAKLSRLRLPLLLELKLAEYIEKHKAEHSDSSEEKPSKRTKQLRQKLANVKEESDRAEVRSALFGITAQERDKLKESWKKLVSLNSDQPDKSGLARLYDTFFPTFATDPKAKKLFAGTTMIQKGAAVAKIMNLLLTVIDDPPAVLPYLRMLAIKHVIWNISHKNYEHFALTFTKSLEAVLGPEIITPDLKEAWYMVIMKMSQIMVDAYAEVREGDMRPLKMLTGRGWKFYTCLLTHETMTIYRSTKKMSVKDTISLRIASEVSEVSDSDIPHHFRLVLEDGTEKDFCAPTAEEQNWWIKEISIRIDAFARLRGEQKQSGCPVHAK